MHGFVLRVGSAAIAISLCVLPTGVVAAMNRVPMNPSPDYGYEFTVFAIGAGVKVLVIGRKAEFDFPPPGAGLETVILAVCAVAISEPRTVAFNVRLFTNFVVSAVPLIEATEPARRIR